MSPSAADLRRLAAELQSAGQQSDRTSRLLAAADAGDAGRVERAIWRPGSLGIYVQGIEGPKGRDGAAPGVVRSAPFPDIIAEFLREEAAKKVDEATQAIHDIAGDAGSAARFGATAKAAKSAAGLLREAATLEETAGACDRGQGTLYIHAGWRNSTALCVRAANVGHVVVCGMPSMQSDGHGHRKYYGVQGACCSGTVCANAPRTAHEDSIEVLLYTLPERTTYADAAPQITRVVAALVARELRNEVDLARGTPAAFARLAQVR